MGLNKRKSLILFSFIVLFLVSIILVSCSPLASYDSFEPRTLSGLAVYEEGDREETKEGDIQEKSQHGSENTSESEKEDQLKISDSSKDTIPDYEGNCFDTDYGIAYDVAGMCYDQFNHKFGVKDYCVNKFELYEYYCSNNPEQGCLKAELYFCNSTFVCYEGRCVDFRSIESTVITLN